MSLPGRFVVLIPNSRTYGISKRLADDERRRLRSILDKVKPDGARPHRAHRGRERQRGGAAGRRAAPGRPVGHHRGQAKQARGPSLLYREPDLAVRVIREEFNAEYRGVVIDDPALYDEVRDYVGALNPELADRVEHYDPDAEGLPLFERHHVHEQLHKALDRKVWLPSGGSLIIEHTEALTVIDVNTGKNVGHLEPRGDGLPQQPGGGRGDRPPAAAARHRRHHRHRLHRHGDPGEPPQGGGRLPGGAGPGQDPHPGVRHLRAGPGRDDPQAHRRGPADGVRRTPARAARAGAWWSTTPHRLSDCRAGSAGRLALRYVRSHHHRRTQERVAEGQRVEVELLGAAEGDEVSFPPVLLVDGDTVLATPDQLKGVAVTATVVGTAKGPKINGFTYKRQTNQRRRYGHRQHYSTVEITRITGGQEGLRRPRCPRPRVAAPPATGATPTPSASA